MKDEKKIIMYDSPEAAEQITLTGWVSKGAGGRFWYKDEHMARWAGCTHLKCECGNIMEKAWLKCDECRSKKARENYQNLPFKEWDSVEYVVEAFGDEYFWSEEELIEYMEENEIKEIDLLICDPINYRLISTEDVAPNSHENYDPPEELEKKINEFNEFLRTLPAHSWRGGKIRTSYKLPTQ